MMLQELESTLGPRKTTIILVCLKTPQASSSIRFLSGVYYDIYLICNFCLLLQYVADLIDRIQSTPSYTYESLSIIIVNKDIPVLLQALRLLQSKQLPEFSAYTKKNFVLMYKTSLINASGSKDLEFEVNIPPGLVDAPLGYETHILQACEGYSSLEHLSEPHVWTQQILRFLALKHGALFGAFSGLQETLGKASLLFDLVDNIKSESRTHLSGHLLFKMEGTPVVGNLLMHQFILPGEDTWSKLILTAKSIPQVKKLDKIYTTELQFQELSDIYDASYGPVSTMQECLPGNDHLLQYMGVEVAEGVLEPAPLLTFKDLLDSMEITDTEVNN